MILALALLSGQDAAPPPPNTLSDIVVQPLSNDPIGRYVGGVTVPGEHGRFAGQVARWDHRLCVSVVGRAQARFALASPTKCQPPGGSILARKDWRCPRRTTRSAGRPDWSTISYRAS